MSLESAIASFKDSVSKSITNSEASQDTIEKFKSRAIQLLQDNILASIPKNAYGYDGLDVASNVYCTYSNGRFYLGINPVMVNGLDKAQLLEFGTGIVAQRENDSIRNAFGFPDTKRTKAWRVSEPRGTFYTSGLSAHRFMRNTIEQLSSEFKIDDIILKANGVEFRY